MNMDSVKDLVKNLVKFAGLFIISFIVIYLSLALFTSYGTNIQKQDRISELTSYLEVEDEKEVINPDTLEKETKYTFTTKDDEKTYNKLVKEYNSLNHAVNEESTQITKMSTVPALAIAGAIIILLNLKKIKNEDEMEEEVEDGWYE